VGVGAEEEEILLLFELEDEEEVGVVVGVGEGVCVGKIVNIKINIFSKIIINKSNEKKS
jgi:hypothetical protein